MRFVAQSVFVVAFVFGSFSAFASPPHWVRQRVRDAVVIVKDGLRKPQSDDRRDALIRMKMFLSQNESDRRIAVDELLRIARTVMDPSSDPEAKRRAEAAYDILGYVDHPWAGPEAFELNLAMLVHRNFQNSNNWSTVLQMSGVDPSLMPRLFATLKNVPASERYILHSEFLRELAASHISAEMMSRWGPWIRQNFAIRELYEPVMREFAVSYSNEVDWVRQAMLFGLLRPKGSSPDYALDSFVLKLKLTQDPLHPEIEAAFLKNPGVGRQYYVRLMANNPRIRAQVLSELLSDPDARVAEFVSEINSQFNSFGEAGVGKWILPALESLDRIDLVEKVLESIVNLWGKVSFDFSPEMAGFILHALVARVESNRPTRNPPVYLSDLKESILIQCLRRIGAGQAVTAFSLPEVQRAIIANDQNEKVKYPEYIELLAKMAHSVPLESFTAETWEFFRSITNSVNAVDILTPRHAAYDRILRSKLLEILETEPASPSAQRAAYLLQGVRSDFPEVEEHLKRPNFHLDLQLAREDKSHSLNERLHREGVSDDYLYQHYIRTSTSPQGETRDVNLLLAGPDPRRSVGRREKKITAEIEDGVTRGRYPESADESPLVSVEPWDPFTKMRTATHPGLSSLAAFFDFPSWDKVDAHTYDVINDGSTEPGFERIRKIRNGHKRRNELLDAEAQMHSGFVLDPVPSLRQEFEQLQKRIRSQAQSSISVARPPESQLPPLTPSERATIESRATMQTLETITRAHPVMEIVRPEGRLILRPDHFLNQAPFRQDNHRLLDQLTYEARVQKARFFEPPPEQQIEIWRRRQMDALRMRFRSSLATIVNKGQGHLAQVLRWQQTKNLRVDFFSRFEGAHHYLMAEDLSLSDISWNTVDEHPILLLDGKPQFSQELQYLPKLPDHMSPDAVSVYMMTEPEAKGVDGKALTQSDLLRETLFRRSVPLLIQYYGEAMRILDPALTPQADLEFQLKHLEALHARTRSIRWIAQAAPTSATAMEAYLWNDGMESLLERENALRVANLPSLNVAVDYHERFVSKDNKSAGAEDGSDPNESAEASVLQAERPALSQPQGSRAEATNSVPGENIIHHVSYLGKTPEPQMPQHFLMGDYDDFRNQFEIKVVDVPPPPRVSPLAWLLRGRHENYPSLVNVRSQEPYVGGKHSIDALLPRPDGRSLAHIEVKDLQGRRLRPGIDYQVLLHEPTGEYAVRLTSIIREEVPYFHISANYQESPQHIASIRTPSQYQIDKVRPLVQRMRAAGFTVLAKKIDGLIAQNLERNQAALPGAELEAAVKNAALYTYRPESGFPKRKGPIVENEFTPWAKFIAEDSIPCMQCDGSNGFFSTFLQSYHEGDPSVRVQPRSEFRVEAGDHELRADQFHDRTHELHLSKRGLATKVIYDATPSSFDPRSTPLDAGKPLRAKLKRMGRAARSHMVEWWRKMRNEFLNARDMILRRGKASALIETHAVSRLSEVGFGLVSPIAAALSESGLPSLNDFLAAPLLIEGPAANSDFSHITNLLHLEPSIVKERQELLSRELIQLRRAVQGVGGHVRLDPTEPLSQAEKLVRTYQRVLENDVSMAQARDLLNSIHPELQLPREPSAVELRDGFTAAANYILTKIGSVQGMQHRSVAHYQGAQGQQIQRILGNLLRPIQDSPSETAPELTQCAIQSLERMR